MSSQPVKFSLPERTIGMLKEYCKKNRIKPSSFVESVLIEYTMDKAKLAAAVAKRILTGSPVVDRTLNCTHRVDPAPVRALRDIAHSADLSFDGLTRIVFEDKLTKA
jgi:hypothetical protein